MQRKKIKIELIETNEGQIEGVPSNPRFIKDAEFEKLKQSIKDFPEMLQIREVVVFPLNGRFVALGGNMRFLGCKDLGYKQMDCVILPENMPVEKLREFAIKDNSGFGAWDFDMLANEWDLALLDMANVTIPNFEAAAGGDPFEDEGIAGKNQFGVIVMCESEREQESIFNDLQDRGLKCKVVVV
jgi:ParB-like chromosome segregation protein Spo0J